MKQKIEEILNRWCTKCYAREHYADEAMAKAAAEIAELHQWEMDAFALHHEEECESLEADLAAKDAALVVLRRGVEWAEVYMVEEGFGCEHCQMGAEYGHAPNCPLGQALSAAKDAALAEMAELLCDCGVYLQESDSSIESCTMQEKIAEALSAAKDAALAEMAKTLGELADFIHDKAADHSISWSDAKHMKAAIKKALSAAPRVRVLWRGEGKARESGDRIWVKGRGHIHKHWAAFQLEIFETARKSIKHDQQVTVTVTAEEGSDAKAEEPAD